MEFAITTIKGATIVVMAVKLEIIIVKTMKTMYIFKMEVSH